MAKFNHLHTSGTYVSKTAPKVQTFECGIHDIYYKSFEPGCPVCSGDRETRELRTALQEARGQLELLTQRSQLLSAQVDVVSAIRQAADIMDDSDTEFIKMTLYLWRDEKSLSLKTTHTYQKRKKRTDTTVGNVKAANGFLVIPRKGDPYAHECTSIGGLAIADYFDEATNTVGYPEAMKMLVRGTSHLLPGSIK